MNIFDMIFEMPWWYSLAMVLFSIYYAYRGIIYQRIYGQQLVPKEIVNGPGYGLFDKIIIDYIQEVLFKVIITVSSFVSLYAANSILSAQVAPFNNISGGTVALIVFLILWGILGICGYLLISA